MQSKMQTQVQEQSKAQEELQDLDQANRRSDDDRRAPADRRRSARGLFELRARRAKLVEDRRQTERRGMQRLRWWFSSSST